MSLEVDPNKGTRGGGVLGKEAGVLRVTGALPLLNRRRDSLGVPLTKSDSYEC